MILSRAALSNKIYDGTKTRPLDDPRKSQKYENSFLSVCEDQVLQPDGQQGSYTTVTIKSGVAVLPVGSDGLVYLTRQFRYSLGKESIEVVSGAVEEQESPLESAKREVQEELGIKADEWTDLGVIDLDTSIINCPVHLFLAKHLTFTETAQEGTENIETVKVSLNTAIAMVMDSAITHSPSCVLILKAQSSIQTQY